MVVFPVNKLKTDLREKGLCTAVSFHELLERFAVLT
jgi:hypothetical protein